VLTGDGVLTGDAVLTGETGLAGDSVLAGLLWDDPEQAEAVLTTARTPMAAARVPLLMFTPVYPGR
jgi:hypothetical protein